MHELPPIGPEGILKEIESPGEKDLKVVQLYRGDFPFLRFGNGQRGERHTDILQRFAREAGISELRYRRGISGDVAYLPEGCDFRLSGAGHCMVGSEKRIMLFCDHSADYRMAIERQHIEMLKPLLEGWRVVVDD